MKSIRLNVKLREEIISNIEQAYEIKNPCPDHKTKAKFLSEFMDVVETGYTVQAEAFGQKAINAGIPITFLKQTNTIRVYTDRDNHFCNRVMRDSDNNYKYLPDLVLSAAFIQLDLLGKYPLIEKAYTHYKQGVKAEKANLDLKRIWEREKTNYLTDVRNVVFGVNTTGQLIEQWEEVEKFIPRGVVDPSRIQLPAVSISQLNKHI